MFIAQGNSHNLRIDVVVLCEKKIQSFNLQIINNQRMPTAAKCVEDNSMTSPFLSVSTEDKVAKAEKPFKVSNSRKFLREFVVWSVV